MSENTFGTYTSVNDLPRFADLIAAQGPFDPNTYITIRKNNQGQYTIDEEPAYTEDAAGNRTQLVLWDFDMYAEDGGVLGMEPVSGFIRTEYGGARYNVFNTIMPNETLTLIYSVNFDVPNGGGQMHMDALSVPSDHPLLQCYRRINR